MHQRILFFLFLALTTFAQAQPWQPDSTTVALWHLDESSGSFVSDASFFQNHGTAIGTTIVPGAFGNARQFNGFTDHIIFPNSPSFNFTNDQSFSVEAWFKTTALGDTVGEIIRRGLAPLPGFALRVYCGRVEGIIGNREDSVYPDTLLRIRTTALYNDGQWHHARLVRDRQAQLITLHVDGVQAATPIHDSFAMPLTNDRPLTIGKWENNAVPTYFQGVIDEIRITAPPRSLNDTLAFWRMDEATGSMVADASQFGNHGTAYGAAIVPGVSGNARQFDGINDYIYVPLPLTHLNFGTNQSFTVQAWFKTTASGTNEIVRRGLAPVPGFALRVIHGRVQGIIGNSEVGVPPDTLLRITSDQLYNDGQWHHAVMVRDRTEQKLFLYVDGALATQPLHDPVSFPLVNQRPLTIGVWETFIVPAWFHGTIDEVGIFKGARHPVSSGGASIHLSATEINFGSVLVGSMSTKSLKVFNRGLTDTLIVTSISSSDSVFSPVSTSMIVAPLSNQTLEISYAPALAQDDSAFLLITSNDSLNPVVEVALFGRGFDLLSAPLIKTIHDIPNDQGKQVRVIWFRSIHDAPGAPLQITEYNLWRRVDDFAGKTQQSGVMHEPILMNNVLWDYIGRVPAVQFGQYAYVAPTLFDSTAFHGTQWSVFMVSAHAGAGEVFFSEPDSGYSIDNIPPHAPGNLVGTLAPGGVLLEWELTGVPDLIHYVVHRGTSSGFPTSPATLIGNPRINAFLDGSIGGSSVYYYKVAGVDSAGNQGPFSPEVPVVITDLNPGEIVPTSFSLYQNYPNPFNPMTTIKIDVPVESHITITVFDVLGRVVAVLLDEQKRAGTHFITWDAAGIPSGVYWYRMRAGTYSAAQRAIVLQ